MNLLIASTSTVHGTPYLSYLTQEIENFFSSKKVIFIPYAQPGGISLDQYTEKAASYFESLGIACKGIHTFENKEKAILEAGGIFTGGGNTFLLLKTLYDLQLMNPLSVAIRKGIPYMGTSAGSNITGQTIGNTNDMPIVYPPSFEALKFLPFNLNPHYLDPDPNSTHMGETRETRINEFHHLSKIPVLGLREGSYLISTEDGMQLRGGITARWFQTGQNPTELPDRYIFKN